VTYQATTGNGNYGTFQNLVQAGLIDSALATGLKYGYSYQVFITNSSPTIPATLRITATPLAYRKTGRRSFFIDESGVLRGADKNGAVATVSDPEIEDECLPYEQCAISDLRALYSAEITYSATKGNGNYGTFTQLYEFGLIRKRLASGFLHGYIFTCTIVPQTNSTPASFKISAVPASYGTSGIRSFFIDESGVLRGADKNGAPANEDDPPI
jgi:hypothetical protein